VQRAGHFDDLAGRQRRHGAGAADLDRRHEVELAGDPRAPPQENQSDDGSDAGEDREQDIHGLPRLPLGSIARVH